MATLNADQPLVISSYCLGTGVLRAACGRCPDAGFTGIGGDGENYWDARDGAR